VSRWRDDQGAAYWAFRALIDDALVSLASRGVTARQVALEAGISEATLSKWRHGDKPGDRQRVQRLTSAIASRLEEHGIVSPFVSECAEVVDAMFPVRLRTDPVEFVNESSSPIDVIARPTSGIDAKSNFPRISPIDGLWVIPLVFEFVFLTVRWLEYRSGRSQSPFDDGLSLPFGLLFGLLVMAFAPLVAHPVRYRSYLEDWLESRGGEFRIPVDGATPTHGARVVVALVAIATAVWIVIPDFVNETSLHSTAAAVPSWAAPGVWPFLQASLVIQALVVADLMLLSLWRMAFWGRTIVRLGHADRFVVVPGRTDGGWWPPLRAAYIAIIGTTIAGMVFKLLSAARLVPIDQQPTMVLVRIGAAVVLMSAVALLYLLERAHEHRDPEVPEAQLLNLSAIGAAIVVTVAVWIIFTG
jgi:transcriptional regulator with XRE-family HTH domain